MVVDTSDLVAILLGGSDAERFARALGAAPVRLLSAVSQVEFSCVIVGRKGEAGRADVELLLRDGAPHPSPLPASGEREGPLPHQRCATRQAHVHVCREGREGEGRNWAVA